MDLTTIGGLLFAIGCILVGHTLEGGQARSLAQAAAAIIVLGGTLGAVAMSFPARDFVRGLRMIEVALRQKKSDLGPLIRQIVDLAWVARRDGVLALEQRLTSIRDPFLKRSVGFLVDGVDSGVARDALETEINTELQDGLVGARVWESAGGFAPTIGILSAVLGLIHAMENLSNPSRLGGGIAVAFVATIYGVGSANLVFLPIANKLKRKLVIERERKTLIAEGVLSIQAGLNPRVLEEKLRAYVGGAQIPPAAARKT